MAKNDKKLRGFTLVELLVSVAIIGLISTMAIVNFRAGQQQEFVRLAASNLASQISKVQNLAQTGVIANGLVLLPAAYGIQIQSDGKIELYGDAIGGTQYLLDSSDTIFDHNKIDVGAQSKIVVDSVTLDGTLISLPLDIDFTPPKAKMYINGVDTKNSLVITLKNTRSGQKKTVQINRISGQISPEY